MTGHLPTPTPSPATDSSGRAHGQKPARRRNAADSRRSLLDAAGELFAERGFDRTTIRDIGERAGLDPTLIARYFGNKAALYLETLRTDFAAEEPGALRDLLDPGRMTELLNRVGRRGPGPIFEAALRQHDDPAVDAEARAVLAVRLVDPLEQRLTARPVDHAGFDQAGFDQAGFDQAGFDQAGRPDQEARLRAEIITAAFVGVTVGRHGGAFPALAGAPPELVAELLARAFGELLVDTGSHL